MRVKKKAITFLFRKGTDQTVVSPTSTAVAMSGRYAIPVKKAAKKKSKRNRTKLAKKVARPLSTTRGSATDFKATLPPPKRIGILDIDVYAGFLTRVLAAINKRQRMFEFHQIEATTPVGLTRSGDRMRKIAMEWGADAKDPDIAKNAYAPDIFTFAKPVSELRGINLLVCIISPMVMDELTVEEDGEEGMVWNHFTTSLGKTIIVSAYGIRDYAKIAKRTFEASLAVLIVGQIVCNYTKLAFAERPLEYHDDTRGCVLDYCGNRSDLIKVLAHPAICKDCLAKVDPDARKDILGMINAISEYRR